MEYSDEPRLVFSPLSQEDYSHFYNLEMNDYSDDASFYSSFINTSDKVLELGCGSGRLTRLLAPTCQEITGIDISQEMIDLAKKKNVSNTSYSCMDMTDFQFATLFDILIIPYNTLNLLHDRQDVKKCLRLCKRHLRPKGKLLLHLYHPSTAILKSAGEKIFQFNILEQANGAKVIKETLKSYCKETGTLTLEERYRDRPMVPDKPNRDLKHVLKLYCPTLSDWEDLLQTSGLVIKNYYGSYDLKKFSLAADTLLLIHATPA